MTLLTDVHRLFASWGSAVLGHVDLCVFIWRHLVCLLCLAGSQLFSLSFLFAWLLRIAQFSMPLVLLTHAAPL
jgi:hypothetical protein